MSLNAIHRDIMVFSDKKERAEEKLNDIIKEINEEILCQRRDYVQTKTKRITARVYSEGCRGYRYKEVYIDNSIKCKTGEIIKKLVPPHYYKNAEYDENYRWQDYVHYF